MADVAMKDGPAQKRARVGTRVVWCVEHKDNEIWKQFPEELAKMVEQAHMHTTKHTHAHAHKQTHVKRGLPVVVDGGGQRAGVHVEDYALRGAPRPHAAAEHDDVLPEAPPEVGDLRRRPTRRPRRRPARRPARRPTLNPARACRESDPPPPLQEGARPREQYLNI